MKLRLLMTIPLLLLFITTGAASLWVWVHPGIRMRFSLGGPDLSIRAGVARVEHIYAYGKALMDEDWVTPGALDGAKLRQLPHSEWRLGRFAFTTGQERRGDGGQFYQRHPRPADYWALTFPLWFPSLLCLLAALLLLLSLKRRAKRYIQQQRVNRGLCSHCAYDLRGTPQRCPECGTPVPAKTGISR